jgi:hypothetical protein
MADPESGDDQRTVPPKPDFSANALRREPAILDATAEDVTPPQAPPEPAPETPDSALPGAETPMLSTDPGAPVEEIAETPPPEAPRRGGGIFASALLALVLGGAAGFGGALVLRQIDDPEAEITALRRQVAHLEMQQPDLARQDAQTAALVNGQADVAKRLATVEAATNANADALTALRGDIAKRALNAPGAPGKAGPPAPDLGPLTQQVAALQAKLTALTNEVDDLSGGLAAQKSQTAATQSLLAQTAAAHADDTAIALIVGSLLRKAEAGLPFAAELSALAAHGADKSALATLEPAAQSGVATSAGLAAQFAGESDAILASPPAPPAKGFFDRLAQDAEGLVRIRKIGDTGGDSLAARVARIEKALDAGAVETAYAQWTALPADARQKSQDFGAAAKRRLETIAAARGLEAAALAHLGKAKS